MARVNPDDLDKVLRDAGVSARTAKKIREANDTAKQPRAQGSDQTPEFSGV